LSIRLQNAVVEKAEVQGGAYLLLLILSRYASDDGSRVFPSVSTMARDTRQSERAVIKQLQILVSKGYLRVVNAPFGRPKEYQIVIHTAELRSPPVVNCVPERTEPRSKTPERRSPDSLDSSLNHQRREEKPEPQTVKTSAEALRAISEFLPKFKPANRETI
jgi:hypothetical protein